MAEDRVSYGTRPVQFRFPVWALEFLARESADQGVTKTEVVVDALREYQERRERELLARGYIELREEMLQEVREWDGTLGDGLDEVRW